MDRLQPQVGLQHETRVVADGFKLAVVADVQDLFPVGLQVVHEAPREHGSLVHNHQVSGQVVLAAEPGLAVAEHGRVLIGHHHAALFAHGTRQVDQAVHRLRAHHPFRAQDLRGLARERADRLRQFLQLGVREQGGHECGLAGAGVAPEGEALLVEAQPV